MQVVHWNPRRRLASGLLGRAAPPGPRVNNFGDLLGPIIVRRMLERGGVTGRGSTRETRVLAVGSILRMARTGDTVWGTGMNGKSLHRELAATALDVRAVRGPLTRQFLLDRGIPVPEVFGDPGILMSRLWPQERLPVARKTSRPLIVPNLHDYASYRDLENVLDPRSDVWTCVSRIASAEMVVGSSLHGVVLADSYGVPARFIRSGTEPEFKYRDYYLGLGRTSFTIASSLEEALDLGPEPFHAFDPTALIEAFPIDLWA